MRYNEKITARKIIRGEEGAEAQLTYLDFLDLMATAGNCEDYVLSFDCDNCPMNCRHSDNEKDIKQRALQLLELLGER